MPPAPQEPENLITEATNLLKETFSDGSLASHSAMGTDSELELEPLHPQSKPKNTGCQPAVFAYRRTVGLALLGTILTGFIFGAAFRPDWSSVGINDDDDESMILPLFADPFPFSQLDPVRDLGLAEHGRPRDDPSFPSYYYDHPNNSRSLGDAEDRPRKALPTNAWYQNMLQAPRHGEPSNLQRAYPGPYLVDVVGIIPGLRVHATSIDASDMVIQLSFNEWFGLVLGGTNSILNGDIDESPTTHSHRYRVQETTDLGITLEWDAMNMTSNIVKGMSFVTMEYAKQKESSEDSLYPTIAAPLELQDAMVIDGDTKTLDCSKPFLVQNDVELYFRQSDHSWMVFFSEPVWLQCSVGNGRTYLQVVDYAEATIRDGCSSPSDAFMVRVALIDQCTNGWNPSSCRKGIGYVLLDEPVKDEYISLLREHVDVYPGRDTSFSYSMSGIDGDDEAKLFFDWDARRMSDLCRKDTSNLSSSSSTDVDALLTFAIPHQMDRLPSSLLPNKRRYCKSYLTGPACLVQGNAWELPLELPEITFRAKRHPKPEYIPAIANALLTDLDFKIPGYFKRGAGDTYFSGKILAKLARILLHFEEVQDLCGNDGGRDYLQFCKNSTLPSTEQFESAFEELRDGVQVWIDGTADTPFVYDTSWGGVVSCGCHMEGTECMNRYPDCPAFSDPGLNFGNGFYNDHHFHYGYHIFAASVVSHFDRSWGIDNFESVLMLVRDIANPSEEDPFFPLFRHKDWFQGSSWASGVPYPAFLNGKNQESSSEAIAAYESVSLFGQVMNKIWEEEKHKQNAAVSKQIANVGKLLAATELVSAKKYWHVPEYTSRDSSQRIYPEQYNKHVVGILWQTMAQFGTWFGSQPYLPIGIQLLPLTPISEDRDSIDWMNSIYKPFTHGCATDFECTESGWAILQLATLATVGYVAEAALKVKELPDRSFENAGGNGESRSNILWYISTRPKIENRIPMVEYDKRGKEEVRPKVLYEVKDCYLPDSCTEEILDREAGDYTCRVRMAWLIYQEGLPQWEACWRVAGIEFPDICGPCDPGANFISKQEKKDQELVEEEEKLNKEYELKGPTSDSSSLQCPPCTSEECNSDLNRCPVYKRTFVCTEGTSKGGCSGDLQFWVQEDQCNTCCEMTDCFDLKDKEAKKFTKDGNALTKPSCPPCTPDICYGKLNQCPIHTAPYLCTEGQNVGGCASSPWSMSESACRECCELKLDC